ncbi:MAG: isochorismatase family protein [Pirellulaceae bacterium]|nr:isochorismatase family protein [Pirellulaceae bacterium]
MKPGWINFMFFFFMSFACLWCDSRNDASERSLAAGKSLELELRARVETGQESGRFHVTRQAVNWSPQQTAVIICDMWDLHSCLNATRRGAEMVPRMNKFVANARARGVTIIHAPSSCMAAYDGHPARRNTESVPMAQDLPRDIKKWCYVIPSEEQGEYPIDQSDGGDDDEPAAHAAWAKKLADMGRNPKEPWKSQVDALQIQSGDFISDEGDRIWSILEHRNVSNVILVGVHTNMCVLGRPFGLRQMAKNGKNVVLVRDLTDTMYNPRMPPYVSHFSGTDFIVHHIEKFVCPTITSDQLLGGRPFRFVNDHRPRLVMVIAEQEYNTRQTLPEFASQHLAKHFSIDYVFANEQDRNDLPGLETLDDADLAVISVRRRVLPKSQLDAVRRFVAAGKPLIGIRTASHAFALRDATLPAGRYAWEEFDADVIGGHYTGHSGEGSHVAIKAAVQVHPILTEVNPAGLQGNGTLYFVSPLADTASGLLTGTIPDFPAEPVAWLNRRRDGGRTFYTSLGHPKDFESPEFNRLLRGAIYWLAGVELSDRVEHGE